MVSSMPDDWAKVNIAKSMRVRGLQHLLHDLHLGAVPRREQRLDPDLAEAELDRPRLVPLVQLAEGAGAQPVELRQVLVGGLLAVQDDDVVEVVAATGRCRRRVGAGVGAG